MAQLNLLPDVKLQYIKARRQKRLVIGSSIIVSAVFFVIFAGLLFYVRFSQKNYMSDLTKDITAATSQLKQKQDLDKILTVQNQLNSLPALHDQKAISSRLFDYLGQLTPNAATISDVELDMALSTLNIKGNADSLGTVNKFADTLKFTDYESSGDSPASGKAFSNVVLASFQVAEGEKKGQSIRYELTFSFDPALFSNIKGIAEGQSQNEAVKLKIPNIISTRSEIQKPGSLFVPQEDEGGN